MGEREQVGKERVHKGITALAMSKRFILNGAWRRPCFRICTCKLTRMHAARMHYACKEARTQSAGILPVRAEILGSHTPPPSPATAERPLRADDKGRHMRHREVRAREREKREVRAREGSDSGQTGGSANGQSKCRCRVYDHAQAGRHGEAPAAG